MKKPYTNPEVEIIELESADLIITSGDEGDGNLAGPMASRLSEGIRNEFEC